MRRVRSPASVIVAILAVGLHATAASGQVDRSTRASTEARGFDFWPGRWVELVDGRPDTSGTTFTVRRSVRPDAFEEEWTLVYEGAAHRSVALRAWDRARARWRLAWLDDEGRFQVWDGRRFGDVWYFVRPFEIDGDRFLSRQAWIPEGDDELIRAMDRSFDGGRTWEVRSRTRFRRVRGPRE